MSRLDTLRSAIVLTLNTVPQIGRVHDRERSLADEAALRALYLYDLPAGGQQLRGWWLRRTATEERSVDTARAMSVDSWTLQGHLAFDDAAASELVLDALVEDIRDAVRGDPTFGGACATGPLTDDKRTDGVQVDGTGLVTFCGVHCHGVALQLRTWRYL
ncbi:hypothetical protein SAMN05216567_106152 [Variovorax sp. OK605]|jgi:hypothetical protein|uniref:hypothetical protein n=1 Tax=Variovorax sp. OK605 TaxID=1855317 RepID=UPI0008F2D685|nr:hypothetical protein [Variovorax sp. OK605]SFP43705.1 hypothetical protein SAMN05216567_106152 [Variovorax sp. OK605]